MRSIVIAAVLLILSLPAWSGDLDSSNSSIYNVRLGYNIGGTTPIGLPATIRKMNSYKLQPNLLLGIDVRRDLWGQWGLMGGLCFENKGMKVDATVKNYHMEIVQGGKRLKGYFTGNTVIKVEQWMATLSVKPTYTINEKVVLKLGPYVSWLAGHKFSGYVYNGYLRENTPTGARVDMGDTEETRATFDFSSDMNRIQFGLETGADWYFGKRLGAFADLTWGLTKVFKDSFDTIEQKLYPIFGTIGLIYKL